MDELGDKFGVPCAAATPQRSAGCHVGGFRSCCAAIFFARGPERRRLAELGTIGAMIFSYARTLRDKVLKKMQGARLFDFVPLK